MRIIAIGQMNPLHVHLAHRQAVGEGEWKWSYWAYTWLSHDVDGVPGTASSYLMQSNYDMDIYGEAPDKMTYTEQANKRAHCKRLSW